MKVAVIYNKLHIDQADVINVFGMPTKERYSPQTVDMVASALERGGHNVRTIEGNRWVIDELQLFMPRVVAGERPGMVFNMAYGIQGQSRYTHIPAMLEMLGIPYVGSGPAGHAVALDKVLAKIVFQRHSLPTPAFWVFAKPDEDVSGVTFPAIVKPKMEAISGGVRVVRSEAELKDAVATIVAEFEQEALVETFIPGREFAVPLLGNGVAVDTLPIVEIDLGGDPNAVQSIDDKMAHPRGKICPAELPAAQAEELVRLSQLAFNALGLLDFARVDWRMDATGGLHILEINSMASLNPTGSYVHAAGVGGLDFADLVNRILDVATVRYFGVADRREKRGLVRHNGKAQPLHVRVRSHLRGNLVTMVESIEQMVAISSHAANPEGVNAVGTWVARRFESLGFHRQVFPQAEVGNILYFSNHDEEENDILILGHLDTVYDYQNHVPFHEERGRIFGSGVAEGKGGIAVTLAALHALRFARALKNVRCGVLLTSDDTSGGRVSRHTVQEMALRSRRVVGTKYGELTGGVVTSCSGVQEYRIELTDSTPPPVGKCDVIAALARQILAIDRLSDEDHGVSISFTALQARPSPGWISDYATVTLTARFVSNEQGAHVDEHLRRNAENGSNGALQAHVKAGARRPAVSFTETTQRFFDHLKELAEMLEVRVMSVHRDSPADICHVPEGVSVLGGLGPLGGDVRSPAEFILRDTLIDRAALLALVIATSGRNGDAAPGPTHRPGQKA